MFRIKIGSDLNDNSASSEQVYFVGSEEQLHKSIWIITPNLMIFSNRMGESLEYVFQTEKLSWSI